MAVVMECAPARSVYIAVPAYDGATKIRATASLVGIAVTLLSSRIDFELGFIDGCCYLDSARNMLTKQFLASTCTDMLFWDADVGMDDPRNVLKLVAAPWPVVAAVYPKKMDQLAWPVHIYSADAKLNTGGLLSVPYCPTGAMRINRQVFEDFDAAYSPTHYDDPEQGELVAYFENKILGRDYGSEDVRFCQKWTELGGEVHISPNIGMSHTGGKHWDGNFAEFIQANMANGKAAAE